MGGGNVYTREEKVGVEKKIKLLCKFQRRHLHNGEILLTPHNQLLIVTWAIDCTLTVIIREKNGVLDVWFKNEIFEIGEKVNSQSYKWRYFDKSRLLRDLRNGFAHITGRIPLQGRDLHSWTRVCWNSTRDWTWGNTAITKKKKIRNANTGGDNCTCIK